MAGDAEPRQGPAEPVEEVEPLAWWSYLLVIAIWLAATEVMEAFEVTQKAPALYLMAALFATFGLLCWMNGRQCGAIHSRISGPAYVLLGLVALAAAIGWVPVGQRPLLWAWFAIFVVAYGVELVWGSDRGDPAS